MHNQIASVVNLARANLMALDRKSLNTTLPTATVELLLKTLIDLGTRDNQTARQVESSNAAFVASRLSGAETA